MFTEVGHMQICLSTGVGSPHFQRHFLMGQDKKISLILPHSPPPPRPLRYDQSLMLVVVFSSDYQISLQPRDYIILVVMKMVLVFAIVIQN